MHNYKFNQLRVWLPWSLGLLVSLNTACGGKKDKGGGGGGESAPSQMIPQQNGPMAMPGTMAITVTADLQGAFGLLVVENEEGSSLALKQRHNDTADALRLSGVPRFALDDTFALQGQQPAPQLLSDFRFPSRAGFGLTADEPSPLQKIDDNGDIADAISQSQPESSNQGGPTPRPLPEIVTIAVAPTKEIYLHFKEPWIYTDAPSGSDPWDLSKGYQCQIFKIKGGTLDELLANAPQAGNLECIDNKHFINSWQTGRNAVFQFDAEGNVYYPGSIPNTNKTVVYKRTRDGSSTTEVINANICVQDFLITESGGVFYTGQSCQSEGGGGGGAGGFFRYVTPNKDGLIEIARDWWDFKFDTSVEDTAAGTTTDTAVFFGPDPTQPNTASWNSACLFKFDPSQSEPSTRISEVITCGGDIWRWMDLSRQVDVDSYGEGWNNYSGNDPNRSPSLNWKREYKRRCESKGQIFAGGGSQISSIQQDSDGQVYVIGNIRKKVEGNLLCSIEVRGPHCVIDGNPVLSLEGVDLDTQALCSSSQGTWVDKGNCSNGASTSESCLAHSRTYNDGTNVCSGEANASDFNNWRNACIPTWQTETVRYNNVDSEICTTAENGDRSTFYDWNHADNRFSKEPAAGESAAASLAAKFIVQNFSCSPVEAASSGDQWTEELRSLARVDKDGKNLVLLSNGTEQAINMWLVNDEPYYSSYDTTLGQYLLNRITSATRCHEASLINQSACELAGLEWSDRMCVASAYVDQGSCEIAGYDWVNSHPQIVIDNFEPYNVAESGSDENVYMDGLDFSSNQYKFGSLNLIDRTLSLKEGLTGTLKTIIILPKD